MKRANLICLWFVLLSICPAHIYAGVTGTLSGIVTDSETDEPIQGVSIMLKDSDLGTIADEEGYFILNNIPGGVYTVRAIMMGYTTKNIEGVVIAMDHNKKLNMTLESTTLDVDVEVTVTAERQMLRQDVTSTMHITTGDELNFMPVKDFQDAIKREPGVVDGHIRGGRETEVLYLIDGIPIQEAIYGDTGANLPNSSIIEMSLQTGGFNAEYGNAMSGVVNVVTKEGTKKKEGMFKFYTDYVGGSKSDHLHQYELNLGAPLFFGNKNSYFLAGDFALSDTRWREEFSDYIDSPNLVKYNLNGKLVTHLNPKHKLVWQGIKSYQTWTEYDHQWKYHLSGLPEQKNNSHRISLTYTHTLSPRTFYKASVSHFYVLNQILGKNNGNYEGYLEDPGYQLVYEPPETTLYFVDGRLSDGDLVKPLWRDSEQAITITKGDFTSQITKHNQMKCGFELTYYDLYMHNVEYSIIPPDSIMAGYPPEEAYSVYVTEYSYYPTSGSAYLQFKTEAPEDITLNYGLRFDFLDPKASRPAVELDFSQNEPYRPRQLDNEDMIDAEVQMQFSPRVGASLPITEVDLVSFNYGHFFQFPLFSYLYTNPGYDFQGYHSLLGKPDLEAEKTVAYEVSWQHLLTEDLKFNISYFNKDIENLIDKVTFYIYDEEFRTAKPFEQYINLAFGTSYGLELYLEKRADMMHWDNWMANLSGKISYSWMHAKGSSSQFGSEYDDEGNIINPPHEYYLSWDQRHTVSASIDYRQPENWGVNLLLRLNSAKPYTDRNGSEPNSERMDGTTYIDLKLNKDFQFGWLKSSFFAEILNALDAENNLWVDDFGRVGGVYNDPTAYDVSRRVNLGFAGRF